MDIDERLSVEQDDATAPMLTEVAPRFAPPNTTGSYFCTFFPTSTDPRLDITAAGAGPILLCGTTGNAATPLQGTRAMADTLEDSHLIVVDAISAGCLGVSQCADDLITDYLVDLDVPAAAETDCPTEWPRERSTIGSLRKHEVRSATDDPSVGLPPNRPTAEAAR